VWGWVVEWAETGDGLSAVPGDRLDRVAPPQGLEFRKGVSALDIGDATEKWDIEQSLGLDVSRGASARM